MSLHPMLPTNVYYLHADNPRPIVTSYSVMKVNKSKMCIWVKLSRMAEHHIGVFQLIDTW
jgi:hypothetical protein